MEQTGSECRQQGQWPAPAAPGSPQLAVVDTLPVSSLGLASEEGAEKRAEALEVGNKYTLKIPSLAPTTLVNSDIRKGAGAWRLYRGRKAMSRQSPRECGTSSDKRRGGFTF